MKNSNGKIDFITDYLSSYQSKIQLMNSTGLFDEAKHFELFAQEICKLWFDKQFKNLNEFTYTYPCVDLVSDDNIFIQVSTTDSIPTKINQTLKNIQNSKKPEINLIKNVKFFMLDNASVNKIKDKTIGNITFNKETDLITTKTILQRANNDLQFQGSLYDLLQKDIALKAEFDKLKEAIEKSKFDIKTTINTLINNEYEIDRSILINKIKQENAKNIIILGQAGFGKSAMCKQLMCDAENVLFSRAENIVQKNNINEIWSFAIKNVLHESNKDFVFFIDSLEFIADNGDKNNLIPYLFEIVKDMPNVKIIASCRTTDYNAFIRLTSQYDIKTYEVTEVTKNELIGIAKKYPIINKIKSNSSYAQLLKNPLYIDLIVSKIINFKDIKNENEFREYIWQKIICQGDNESKTIVKQIVFNRAKNFLLYVNADDFDSKTINSLVSNGVLIKKNSLVRLKYDIFEDICFERYFDDEFNNSKGDYLKFFNNISSMGRCVYRRYQIWVANKLLNKENRNKVINKIIFSNTTPTNWGNQTIIGLIKSKFSKEFFTESTDEIIKNDLLDKFIYLTNLYGFEVNTSWLAKYSPVIKLSPSGEGRKSLLEIVYNKEIHKQTTEIKNNILKLISDYVEIPDENKEADISQHVVNILIHYLNEKVTIINNLNSKEKENFYKKDEYAISLLSQLYQISNLAIDWITDYWKNLEKWYKNDLEHYAEHIIKFTISFENCVLAKNMPKQLCQLAEMFWTYNRPKNKSQFNFYDNYDVLEYQYGLNKQAKNYAHENYRNSPVMSNFFHTLFYCSFWEGIKWAISFINKAVLQYQINSPDDCFEYEIKFLNEDCTKKYIGNNLMWISTTIENHMPVLLSDLLYCLQELIIQIIQGKWLKEKTTEFANNVKKYIYDNSNNIATLSIISNIGLKFDNELPGYALDLATNINIVMFDIQRKGLMIPNPTRDLLEKQIVAAVGIPNLQKRYKLKTTEVKDLQDYVANAQIYCLEDIQNKCYKILDYLYALIPNNRENATEYLQIQKMDLRNADLAKVDTNMVELIPKITGEAKKIIINNKKRFKSVSLINSKINYLQKKYSNTKLPLNEINHIIDIILKEKENLSFNIEFDRFLIIFICYALQDSKLSKKKREKYCQLFLNSINGYLINNKKLLVDLDLCSFLFKQLETNISIELKNNIKLILLESIIARGDNGLIKKISNCAKEYIKTNPVLVKSMFNTIIKLAEDEMSHQKFNADYIKKSSKIKDFVFTPNLSPKLIGVDKWIAQEKNKNAEIQEYQSKRDNNIKDYLYEGKALNLQDFTPENYDISLLCYALNCGVQLSDEFVESISLKALKTIIYIWENYERNNNLYEILDVYTLFEIEIFFRNQLTINESISNKTLDMMFTNIDFSKFTKDAVEFYHRVYFEITIIYFDSHNDNERRTFMVSVFTKLENKILAMSDGKVKDSLKKSLIFYFPQFSRHDWSNCLAGYSYKDKEFINNQFIKYGSKSIDDMLLSIKQFHVDKLLPEILISLNTVFQSAKNEDIENFKKDIYKNKETILFFMSKAFINFSDEIKQDESLINAFENILEILCDYGFEEAAVILDEFRIH